MTKKSIALILFGILLASFVQADQFASPAIAGEFKGTVTGKVKWVHKSKWWFMMDVKSLKPENGNAAKFAELTKLPKGLKIGISWNGPGKPNQKQLDFVKSLKPGQEITLQLVPGYKGKGVRIADGSKSTGSKQVKKIKLKDPAKVVYGATIDESKVKHVLKVNPKDNSALPTIKAAWEKAKPLLQKKEAVKIQIAPGIYRESLGHIKADAAIRETLLVIEGAGPEKTIWSGSDQIPAAKWQDIGDGLYATDWQNNWGNHCYVWETPQPLGHRSEMVFVDGTLMTQVLIEKYKYHRTGKLIDHAKRKHYWEYKGFLDPKTAMPPATFGVAEKDKNGNKIYLHLPKGKTIDQVKIEVAMRRSPFRFDMGGPMKPGKNNLVLRGITFQHFANRTKDWGAEAILAIGRKYKQILIEDCNFLWNNATGVQLEGSNITVRRCNINYNGFSGIGGQAGESLFEDNVTNFNNWRGAWGGLRGWNWGGVKFGGHAGYQKVRNHQSIGNLAHGFWYDVHPYYLFLDNITTAANDGHGLFFELSQGPYDAKRILSVGNTKAQFNMSIVGQFNISDSIFYGNTPGTRKLKNKEIPNNLVNLQWYLRTDNHAHIAPIVPTSFKLNDCIFMTGNQQTGFFTEHNGIHRNKPNYALVNKAYQGKDNLFYSAAGKIDFTYVNKNWQAKTVDLAGWQKWTRELNPITTDPGFRDPENYDFRLKEGSPLATRSESLPLQKVDPKLIVEAKRMREWVEIAIRLNGEDPSKRLKEE